MRKLMMTGLTLLTLAAVATVAMWLHTPAVPVAQAHCQMPCGIYDDPARVGQLREDARTIHTAIRNLQLLAGKNDVTSVNQAVRWVQTKEEHASLIQEVVADYFLTQRVKPVAPGGDGYEAYLKSLADHHAVMVAAMKTKQVPTEESAAALDKAIDGLAAHYAAAGMPAKSAAPETHAHEAGPAVPVPAEHGHEH